MRQWRQRPTARMSDLHATVIGAGLAGCEAAWQLLRRGIDVELVDYKPDRRSPAHQSGLFAELVCSNSLRSERLENAVGLLKAEMRCFDSLLLRAAEHARVPAGGALAVDREVFAQFVTDTLLNQPRLHFVSREATQVPDAPAVIATGPLTDGPLAQAIAELSNQPLLSFYDAAAPIVTKESIDMERVFAASRYERGDDYLNCPLDREQYEAFYQALIGAQTAPVAGFEESRVFEGCMPVESMARRGAMALAFGPLKPVGLVDPHTGKMPFAVVQLRREDAADSLYNLVGFQTRLRFGEQRRVFSMIPGLEQAEFVRYGVMHRNTFLHSPGFLNEHFEVIGRPGLFFAGQITGVEGYVESAASGLVAALHLAAQLKHTDAPALSARTALGALGRYVSVPNHAFQPMHITFGLLDALPQRVRGKEKRFLALSQRALAEIQTIARQQQPTVG